MRLWIRPFSDPGGSTSEELDQILQGTSPGALIQGPEYHLFSEHQVVRQGEAMFNTLINLSSLISDLRPCNVSICAVPQKVRNDWNGVEVNDGLAKADRVLQKSSPAYTPPKWYGSSCRRLLRKEPSSFGKPLASGERRLPRDGMDMNLQLALFGLTPSYQAAEPRSGPVKFPLPR